MEEITKAKIEEKRKEREKQLQLAQSYDYNKFKTRFLENILEEQMRE